jgi:hypothetical protein
VENGNFKFGVGLNTNFVSSGATLLLVGDGYSNYGHRLCVVPDAGVTVTLKQVAGETTKTITTP